jgi:CRP/FNR family nitrogen fixation transcriptional regulator
LELADVDGVLLQYLLGSTAQSLHHAEDHLLLLGRKEAIEKVAAFLLEWTSGWQVQAQFPCL